MRLDSLMVAVGSGGLGRKVQGNWRWLDIESKSMVASCTKFSLLAVTESIANDYSLDRSLSMVNCCKFQFPKLAVRIAFVRNIW